MLPDSWVDRLFAILAVRYGDAWLRKWDGIDIAAVRRDWASVLSGVSAHAIEYGLNNLPLEHPPTATAFREICSRRPDPQRPALMSKMPVNHEAVARIRAKIAEFQEAATMKRQELEQRSQSNARSLSPARSYDWAPQGPLPWPRGTEPPQHEDAR